MPAKKFDIVIEQGKTFQQVVRWEALPLVYKPITAIGNVAPVLITAAGHGCPDGWRAYVTGVVGMNEINAKSLPPKASDFHKVTVVDTDRVSFNDVSAAFFDPYISGGYLVYYSPVPLTGYSARMKIKDRVGGTMLVELVSPADITVDEAGYTILMTIAASASEGFAWKRGVYDLEVVSPTGVVTALLAGSVTVTPEVTTTL